MKNLRKLLFFIAMFIIAGVVASSGDRKQAPEREKAREYFYNGTQLQMLEKDAEAFEMFRKAYSADSTFTPAAYMLGKLMLIMTNGDIEQSLALMRKYVDEYPEDFLSGKEYAFYRAVAGSMDESIEILERIVAIDSTYSEAYDMLMRFYLRIDENKKALEAIKKYEKLEGASESTAYARLSCRMYDGDTIASIAEAKEILSEHPDATEYITLLGSVYMAYQMNDSARITFEYAEKLAPESSSPKLALSKVYANMGDSVQSDNKLYEALLLEDMDMETKAEIVAEYLQDIVSNKQPVARGDHLFSVLTKQYPHEPVVLDLAARYSAAKGEFVDAIEYIGYAIDQEPANEQFWQQKIFYLIQIADYMAAIRTADEGLVHFADSEKLRELGAGARQLAGLHDEALDIYRGLITKNVPGIDPDTTVDLSLLTDCSLEDLEKLSSWYQSMGDIYYSIDSVEQALANYDNAIKIYPYNAMAFNNYAYYISETGGDLDKAYEYAQEALRLQPDNPTIMDTYAWVLFKRGDYEMALLNQAAAIEKAVEKDQVSMEFYSHYGDILYMNGKHDEALDAWKQALELADFDSDPKEVRLLRKKIQLKNYFSE